MGRSREQQTSDAPPRQMAPGRPVTQVRDRSAQARRRPVSRVGITIRRLDERHAHTNVNRCGWTKDEPVPGERRRQPATRVHVPASASRVHDTGMFVACGCEWAILTGRQRRRGIVRRRTDRVAGVVERHARLGHRGTPGSHRAEQHSGNHSSQDRRESTEHERCGPYPALGADGQPRWQSDQTLASDGLTATVHIVESERRHIGLATGKHLIICGVHPASEGHVAGPDPN